MCSLVITVEAFSLSYLYHLIQRWALCTHMAFMYCSVPSVYMFSVLIPSWCLCVSTAHCQTTCSLDTLDHAGFRNLAAFVFPTFLPLVVWVFISVNHYAAEPSNLVLTEIVDSLGSLFWLAIIYWAVLNWKEIPADTRCLSLKKICSYPKIPCVTLGYRRFCHLLCEIPCRSESFKVHALL